MERDYHTIVKAMEGNQRCADCDRTSPSWCSVSFGVLMCVECLEDIAAWAFIFRSFGVWT